MPLLTVSRRSPLSHEVTCCDDCPFSVARVPFRGPDSFWCNHEALGGEAKSVLNGSGGVPAWCPLKWGPTLVKLKVEPTPQAHDCAGEFCWCGGGM